MNERMCRAKSIETDLWVYGSLVVISDYLDGKQIFCIVPDNAVLLPHNEIDEIVPVREETIGRYAGMNDVYGRWIFEGDIVSYKMESAYHNCPYTAIGPVIFSDCCYIPLTFGSNIKVIGNTIDDPALYERSKNGRKEFNMEKYQNTTY